VNHNGVQTVKATSPRFDEVWDDLIAGKVTWYIRDGDRVPVGLWFRFWRTSPTGQTIVVHAEILACVDALNGHPNSMYKISPVKL
jgi:hypothetical protein